MKVLVFKDIKNKRWTIWDEQKKKHLGYADEICLKDCVFVVKSESRKKILASRKRFPHAWIIGEVSKTKPSSKKEIKYNPFLHDSFMKKNKPVFHSKKVFLSKEGKVFG